MTIGDDPWFVAADVFEALAYPKGSRTYQLKQLRDDEAVVLKSKTLIEGVRPDVKIISESGLYKLIMRSDKPQAKKFQDWVTRDVLPAIRKDGAYVPSLSIRLHYTTDRNQRRTLKS
ncbi:MAG: BRO family protein [Pseudomonadota bacterium]|nr:BRO family protein [Pseudomonadota bacterium]